MHSILNSLFERWWVVARCVDCMDCGKPFGTRTRGRFVICCCVVHRSMEFIVVIALLVLVLSFYEVASVSEHFASILSFANGYSKLSRCKY